jgi:hypothetical protein
MSNIDFTEDGVPVVGQSTVSARAREGWILLELCAQDTAHWVENHLEHGFGSETCPDDVRDGLRDQQESSRETQLQKLHLKRLPPSQRRCWRFGPFYHAAARARCLKLSAQTRGQGASWSSCWAAPPEILGSRIPLTHHHHGHTAWHRHLAEIEGRGGWEKWREGVLASKAVFWVCYSDRHHNSAVFGLSSAAAS